MKITKVLIIKYQLDFLKIQYHFIINNFDKHYQFMFNLQNIILIFH